jgi:glutathione synthase/RimK-type ligase-like ATP-grasp enzyme
VLWEVFRVPLAVVSGRVRGYDLTKVDPKLLQTAIQAASAIGNSLFGVDLKQVGADLVVIEVTDNPIIARGRKIRRPLVYMNA